MWRRREEIVILERSKMGRWRSVFCSWYYFSLISHGYLLVKFNTARFFHLSSVFSLCLRCVM